MCHRPARGGIMRGGGTAHIYVVVVLGVIFGARGARLKSSIDPEVNGVLKNERRTAGTEKELWLTDHEETRNYEMQSDASEGQRSFFRCPPPPTSESDRKCRKPMCSNDRQCDGEGQRCCYNGCVFTCMAALKTHVLIDWMREPRHRLASGKSWLVAGPERSPLEEACSTSIFSADESPLLCPHGYVCHIDYFGDPQKNIPNRGRCIKNHVLLTHEHGTQKSGRTTRKGVCLFSKRVFPDKSKFIYNHHLCTCTQGAITCKVNTNLQKSTKT